VKHILAGPSFDLIASCFTKKYLCSFGNARIFLPRLKQKYLKINRRNAIHATLFCKKALLAHLAKVKVTRLFSLSIYRYKCN